MPTEMGLVDFAALCFSMVPWALGAVTIVVAAFHCITWRRPNALSRAGSVCFFLIAPCEWILKPLAQQPRPPTSCCASVGMPSSHSMVSMGMTVWLLMECNASWSSLALLLLLMPVPFSRLWLGDHTVEQVFCGCVCGAFVAIAAHIAFLRYPLRRK